LKNSILINGILEDVSMHESLLSNRAFRYGDGLFETIRIYNGTPLFAEYHHKRLIDGLNLLKIESEEKDNLTLFKNNLNKIIISNRIREGGRIRYSISRNSGGYYKPLSTSGISIVEANNIEDNFYKLNDQGVQIEIYEDILKPINILSPFKNAFSLIHVLAGIHNSGINYESILLNEQKNICEGVSSNIFILKNNILYTPSLNQGCVNGIMRFILINYLSKKLNIEVVETKIKSDFFNNADEIFFTNVIQGIKWVLGFGKKRYYNTFSKLLTQNLNEFIEASLKI